MSDGLRLLISPFTFATASAFGTFGVRHANAVPADFYSIAGD